MKIPISNPELDVHDFLYDNSILIVLETHYGGDVGTGIRYNNEEFIWELVEWNCNEPQVCYKDKNPFVLIEKAKELS